MSNSIDDAAARARAEAQRRIEAQRRAEAAARAAAKKAAAAAAKIAAAAASKAKKTQPPKVKVAKNDEFSTGRARALRVKELGSRPLTIAATYVDPPVVSVKPAPAPTPSEKAATETTRLTTLAATDPKAAAEGLKTALASKDAAYRKAVVDQAGAVTKAVAAGLDGKDKDTVAAAVKSITETLGKLSSGQARQLGTEFARGLKGDLGGFKDFHSLTFPKGPIGAALQAGAFSNGGVGEFIRGLLDGAKETGNIKLTLDASHLAKGIAVQGNASFKDAKSKVDQLNGELNNLVKGFGKGAKNPAALQKAVAEFKERHKEDYAKFEAASAAVVNTLELAPAVLEHSKNLETILPYLQALKNAPDALASTAGQAALSNALEAQSRGEPSILDTLGKFAQGKDGKDLREKLGPLISQAMGTRITELKAAGRTDDAHALIGTLSKNEALFDLKPGQLAPLQTALNNAVDGQPGALAEVNLALSTVSALTPENSRAVPALKGLGFVVGVAGLPGNLAGLSDAQLHTQIATVASTLGLGADGGSLAIKALSSGGGLAALDTLFGRVSAGAGIIGAVAGVIDFGKTIDSGGSIGDLTVSGLSAAAGVLLCIPGGQIAGVGLAIASFALSAVLGDRRAEEAEHASEGDAKQFLIDSGLSPDFAAVFSNLNDNKQNIGALTGEVAKKLGLTQQEFFEKLNAAKGDDRKKLLFEFGKLSVVAELDDELGDGGKFPIFGPRLTVKDLEKLDILDDGQKKKLVEAVNGKRDKIVEQLAKDIAPSLD